MSTKRPINYMVFRRPRTRAVRTLNNIYVINSIARSSLIEARSQLKTGTRRKLNYDIPGTSGERIVVERRRSKILGLLKESIDRDLFKQSIIAAVAITEDYFVTTLRTVLEWYPQKLATGDKKVDLSLILECDDLEELLGRLVEKRIYSAFYESPEEYFKFMEDTLSITIPKTQREAYQEVKATRDILVHNAGVVNASYRRKAGPKARAQSGTLIPIDAKYFDACIRCMKALVVSVYSAVLAKYGDVRRKM